MAARATEGWEDARRAGNPSFGRLTHALADAHPDDRGRAGLAARGDHAVDHEGLDGVDALGGNRHLEERVVFGAAALGHHLQRHAFRCVIEIDVDHRHFDPA